MKPLILTALTVSLSACGPFFIGTFGDGKLTDVTKEVPAFTRVTVNGPFVTQVSPGEQSVVLHLDQNLQGLVTARVEAGELIIEAEPMENVYPSAEARVLISMPSVTGVHASGAGDLSADFSNQACSTFSAKASGASHLTLLYGGQCTEATVSASGASTVKLTAAAVSASLSASGASTVTGAGGVETADVDASGASTVTVRASGMVRGTASGASLVVVRGPASVAVESSGASSINREP